MRGRSLCLGEGMEEPHAGGAHAQRSWEGAGTGYCRGGTCLPTQKSPRVPESQLLWLGRAIPALQGRTFRVCWVRPVHSLRGRGAGTEGSNSFRGAAGGPASTPRASKSVSSPAEGRKQEGNGDLWRPVG